MVISHGKQELLCDKANFAWVDFFANSLSPNFSQSMVQSCIRCLLFFHSGFLLQGVKVKCRTETKKKLENKAYLCNGHF